MPNPPEKVYTSQNLRFATHEQGRLPTLYFRTSHGSGRLRQEHPSGPKVQDVRMHTSHAFFPTLQAQEQFSQRFTKGMTRQEFRDLRRELGGRHTPTEGYHHFEATFGAHAKTGTALLTHKSGGTVLGSEQVEALRARVPQIYSGMTGGTK